MAHFFVVVGGSKIHERMAHFFIDIYNSFRRQAETERCELVLTCERATKRCISGGKNDQKYGIYPFDKLELNKIAARWPAKAVAQFFFL